MEPLFVTKTKYTFEEYKKFCNIVNNRESKLKVKLIVAELILLLAALILQNVFLIVFVVIYPPILWLVQKRIIKKNYESNALLKDAELKFEFYDSYFLEKSKLGESRVEYSYLYKVLENDTNFYLMIAKNQGYIILKENCSEELIKFITELRK